MNNINLIGRLGKDPEMTQTQTGTQKCDFSIAVARGDKNKSTDWFNCTAFDKTAQFITTYFSKGKMIALTGSVQINQYTSKENEQKTFTNVVVNRAYFAGEANNDNIQQQNNIQQPQQNFNQQQNFSQPQQNNQQQFQNQQQNFNQQVPQQMNGSDFGGAF